jgi:uncharacterized protein (UPF0264 family)
MQLLVSVTSPEEAATAVDGGADVIDAKDPSTGALGAVAVATLRQIHSAVAGRRTLSAALGDLDDEESAETRARAFAAVGIGFVKIGFAGVSNPALVARILSAAVRAVREVNRQECGVVGVAYADIPRTSSIDFTRLVNAAAGAEATGVLVDTAIKDGPGLLQCVSPAMLRSWVSIAHDAGLTMALAGRLTVDDLSLLCDTGADIVGVRGAACKHGRTSRVDRDRIRTLAYRVQHYRVQLSRSAAIAFGS